jgi:hypothetical protein
VNVADRLTARHVGSTMTGRADAVMDGVINIGKYAINFRFEP